jgi:2-polyprenyl-3-methyl-5-hydroxy-6-metoxy-1,4-benzoquinol methylase
VINYEPFVNKNAVQSQSDLKIGSFDGLISHNLLEHLQDPVKALLEMKSYIKPGVPMFHSTPCWDYSYQFSEFHLFFFVGNSVNVMAQRAGLRATRLSNLIYRFD